MIKVILVDDHEIFREGMKSIIQKPHTDIVIAGEAGSGEDLFHLLTDSTADIVLLDIVLPDMSGIDVARRLKKEYPNMRILMISSENNIEIVKKLTDIGVEGFISKRMGSSQELVNAIHSIINGCEYFGKDIASIIYKIFVAQKNTTEITAEFTEREREVLLLCRDGLQGKEIADKLGISLRTVDNHKSNIFRKLGINNTMDMVQYALKKGIIKVES
jgi:DNA-binding NarL/FixJ family response regulator